MNLGTHEGQKKKKKKSCKKLTPRKEGKKGEFVRFKKNDYRMLTHPVY